MLCAENLRQDPVVAVSAVDKATSGLPGLTSAKTQNALGECKALEEVAHIVERLEKIVSFKEETTKLGLETGWVLVNRASGSYDEQATSTPYYI